MRNFILFLLLFCCFSCANKGNLTGGEKDETPPEITNLVPQNGSTNFQAKSIVFEFDENIRLNDINGNLLVSPPLQTRPKIKQKAKSFELIIQDTLQENTTYTFNFGDAIQDLNENNPISGYTYVFSTGEEIDSLTYSGSAINAFDSEIPDNAWVILHKNLSDTAIVKEKPYYLAKVDPESGDFNFQYLAEGEYNIYGLVDVNLNYQYDQAEESFAFVESPITINGPSFTPAELVFFEREENNTYIKEITNPKPGQFLTLLQGTKDSLGFQVNNLKNKDLVIWEKAIDSVLFWLPTFYEEEEVTIFSTTGINKADTITVDYEKKPLVDSLFRLSGPEKETYDFRGPLRFKTPAPADLVENIEVVLLEDSLYVAGGLTLVKDSLVPNLFHAQNDWLYGRKYDLEILPGTFLDIYGNTNDTLNYSFQVLAEDAFSKLLVKLLAKQNKQYIIQLLSAGNVAYEKVILADDGDSFEWTQLVPRGYNLRVIIDENGNGEWDTGSYEDRLQPEKVINFPDKIDLRPDWETNLQIDLSE